jgi:hypothetical protein
MTFFLLFTTTVCLKEKEKASTFFFYLFCNDFNGIVAALQDLRGTHPYEGNGGSRATLPCGHALTAAPVFHTLRSLTKANYCAAWKKKRQALFYFST